MPSPRSESDSDLEEERRLMYVGITRAKEKLYLTHAQSRKVWGHYQTNPKSMFLKEIPQDLIEEESISRSFSGSKSSFSSTVSKIKEKKSYNSYSSAQNQAPKASGLLSSIERIKQSSAKAQETAKTSNNLASSLEKIKKMSVQSSSQTPQKVNYKTVNAHVVKKNQEEKPKLSIQEMIQKAKNQASKTSTSAVGTGLFPVGTRVFHSAFGVGRVKEIIENNNEKSYVIEFGKHGEKTLDSTTSGLKTF